MAVCYCIGALNIDMQPLAQNIAINPSAKVAGCPQLIIHTDSAYANLGTSKHGLDT